MVLDKHDIGSGYIWTPKSDYAFSKDHYFGRFLNALGMFCRFFCPVCSKSVCDMSKVWEKLDEEVTYLFV